MLERFLRYHMRWRHSRRQAKRAALVRLLGMLRKDGCIAAAKVSPPSPAQELLGGFEHYLSDELGLGKPAVAVDVTTAVQVLSPPVPEHLARVASLDAE